MKKSLLITDDQKYGRLSGPATPSMPGEKEKEKPKKRGILIELVGPQVDAFCSCSKKVGDTGTAEVHYVVKSNSEGDEYDNTLPTKDGPKRMKLLLTHVEADDEGAEGDDKADSPSEETSEESTGEDKSDGDGEEAPSVEAPDRLSPKDAGLDDEE